MEARYPIAAPCELTAAPVDRPDQTPVGEMINRGAVEEALAIREEQVAGA